VTGNCACSEFCEYLDHNDPLCTECKMKEVVIRLAPLPKEYERRIATDTATHQSITVIRDDGTEEYWTPVAKTVVKKELSHETGA